MLSNQQNLLRSIKTETQYSKANYYQSDGSGRDFYITLNNGGLTVPQKFGPQISNGVPFIFKSHFQSPKPSSNIRSIHYIPDGTGRDNYILKNQNTSYDGLGSFSKRFEKSLRNPVAISPSIRERLPSLYASQQRQQCTRLSQPKYGSPGKKSFNFRTEPDQ